MDTYAYTLYLLITFVCVMTFVLTLPDVFKRTITHGLGYFHRRSGVFVHSRILAELQEQDRLIENLKSQVAYWQKNPATKERGGQMVLRLDATSNGHKPFIRVLMENPDTGLLEPCHLVFKDEETKKKFTNREKYTWAERETFERGRREPTYSLLWVYTQPFDPDKDTDPKKHFNPATDKDILANFPKIKKGGKKLIPDHYLPFKKMFPDETIMPYVSLKEKK
jgi:hypothetical protein